MSRNFVREFFLAFQREEVHDRVPSLPVWISDNNSRIPEIFEVADALLHESFPREVDGSGLSSWGPYFRGEPTV